MTTKKMTAKEKMVVKNAKKKTDVSKETPVVSLEKASKPTEIPVKKKSKEPVSLEKASKTPVSLEKPVKLVEDKKDTLIKTIVKTESGPDPYTGSRAAIRNTLKRHIEGVTIHDDDSNTFDCIGTDKMVFLNVFEINVIDKEGIILARIPYGKRQYAQTAKAVNLTGGCLKTAGRGGGRVNGSIASVTGQMKSLEKVLKSNGFTALGGAKFLKDQFMVELTQNGWKLEKEEDEVSAGIFGRGTMATIKKTMAAYVPEEVAETPIAIGAN